MTERKTDFINSSDQRPGFMAMYADMLQGSGYHMELNKTPTEKCINVYWHDERKRCLSVWLKNSGLIDVVFRKELYESCKNKVDMPAYKREHNNQYHVRMDRDAFHRLMQYLVYADG